MRFYPNKVALLHEYWVLHRFGYYLRPYISNGLRFRYRTSKACCMLSSAARSASRALERISVPHDRSGSASPKRARNATR